MCTQLSILDVRQQFLQKVLIACQQEQMHQCSETWGRPHTEHGGHGNNGSSQNDSSHTTGAHSRAVVAAARNLGAPLQLTLQVRFAVWGTQRGVGKASWPACGAVQQVVAPRSSAHGRGCGAAARELRHSWSSRCTGQLQLDHHCPAVLQAAG